MISSWGAISSAFLTADPLPDRQLEEQIDTKLRNSTRVKLIKGFSSQSPL
jgi:hypothetical protein